MITRNWKTARGILAAAVLALWASDGRAQPPADAVETDPIQCWWRTTAGAVRVGEAFSLVLTCGVVETDAVKVVPDQSKLDPTAIQLPPFDVLGGSHGADLRSDDRRFFQYDYRLRVISDTLFNKDVKLPVIRVPYRVQTRMEQGGTVEGIERTYQLPLQIVKVLSVVPAEATDIRDAGAETFDDVDARAVRASTLLAVGGVLFTLAALVALVGLIRLFRLYRVSTPQAKSLVPDFGILRGVERELSDVSRQREASGWTPELAARALAAIRIAAGYALGHTISQSVAKGAHVRDDVGRMTLHRGLLGRKHVNVSNSVTANMVAQEIAARSANGSGRRVDRLETLERALSQFTQAQYGRSDVLESSTLDESVSSVRGEIRRLKFEHTWLAKKLRALSARTVGMMGIRAWAR